MPADKFGRYVWLIDIIRSHPNITFEEISEYWVNSALGDGKPLPWRTFMNHKKKIETIFDVIIECGKGYRYYIAEANQLEGDNFRTWLIDSYTVMNQVQADRRLEGRIIFEDVPSGSTWLTTITNAIRNSKVLKITHQGYGKPKAYTFEIEPYYLKLAKRRWYVVARSEYLSDKNKKKNSEKSSKLPENVYLVYGLDRISACTVLDKSFKMNPDFDIDEYFEGCCGVIPSDAKAYRVVIKASHKGADYLRSLPLHKSQVELTDQNDKEAVYFELFVKPTYDLFQTLLAQGDQIEVLEPKEIRDQMKKITMSLMKFYI